MDLYRFYDSNDQLLYIGISLHAAQRASQHRRDKPWWPDVYRMEVQHLECDRREAEQIERSAIIDETPLYNLTHSQREQTSPLVAPTLVWLCAICEEPIEDGSGYVEMPNTERRRFFHQQQEFDAKYPPNPSTLTFGRVWTGGQLFEMPEPAQWWALHRTCDENPEDSGYWFDIARTRTVSQLLDWTLHLMEKNWIDETDWTHFVRTVLLRNQMAVFA